MDLDVPQDPGVYEFWECIECKARPGEPCKQKDLIEGVWDTVHLDRHKKASFGRLYPKELKRPCPTCKAHVGETCGFRGYGYISVNSVPCHARKMAAQTNIIELPAQVPPSPAGRNR